MKRIDTDNAICILMNGDVYMNKSPVNLSLVIANSSEKIEIKDYELYTSNKTNLLIYRIDKEIFTVIYRNNIDYYFCKSLNWQPVSSDMKEYFAERLMQ